MVINIYSQIKIIMTTIGDLYKTIESEDHKEIIEKLCIPSQTPLSVIMKNLIECDDYDNIKIIAQYVTDPMIKANSLMHATLTDKPIMVELLLQKGSPTCRILEYCFGPMYTYKPECAKLLIEAGADISILKGENQVLVKQLMKK